MNALPWRLTFEDPQAEAGFQAQLADDLVPVVRLGLLGGMWLWPAIVLLAPLIAPVNEVGVLAIAGTMFFLNVLTLLVLRTKPSLHRIEAIGAFEVALSGIAIVALVPVSGVPSLAVFVVPGLMSATMYAFVVFQLPPGPGLAAASVLIVAYLVAPLDRGGTAAVVLNVLLLCTIAGLAAVAAYSLERSMRERFRQGRLIEAQKVAIAAEQAKSDRLLGNVLPPRIAARLRDEPGALAEQFDSATVLFADLVGFTPLSERLGPQMTADMLNDLVTRFDNLADHFGLEKIKTIGDAYLVVGGVPEAIPDHAVRVVSMGLAMVQATSECASSTNLPLAIRVGIHSGPVVAGVIGRTKFAYDVWGDTVNVASRLESSGLAGEVQVSQTTVDELGGAFEVEPRGPVELRGKGSVEASIVRLRSVGGGRTA